ncbi:MAG: hypothetical protein AVDCRST_MAG25-4, partial [uncultured Rubrobacteraceae bacterium]
DGPRLRGVLLPDHHGQGNGQPARDRDLVRPPGLDPLHALRRRGPRGLGQEPPPRPAGHGPRGRRNLCRPRPRARRRRGGRARAPAPRREVRTVPRQPRKLAPERPADRRGPRPGV